MKLPRGLTLAVFLWAAPLWGAAPADGMTAGQLLSSSIAHHDPSGAWATFDHVLIFRESRPDGSVRNSRARIDLPGEFFELESRTDRTRLVRRLARGECAGMLNGSSTFSQEEAEEHRLTCAQIRFYRDYYTYLWGLPMKLEDPGTIVDPEVTRTTFQGDEVVSLRVSYDPEVGGDTWYFYFHPSSHALVGYRFFHDEAKNDGEYIVLEDEYELGGMRLPRKRTWYVNADDRLLGTDELVGDE